MSGGGKQRTSEGLRRGQAQAAAAGAAAAGAGAASGPGRASQEGRPRRTAEGCGPPVHTGGDRTRRPRVVGVRRSPSAPSASLEGPRSQTDSSGSASRTWQRNPGAGRMWGCFPAAPERGGPRRSLSECVDWTTRSGRGILRPNGGPHALEP